MVQLDRSVPILQDSFTLNGEAPSHRFALAQEFFSPHFEMERLSEARGPFRTDVLGYNLGTLQFLTVQMGARRNHRAADRIHSHSADHWFIELFKRGNIASRSGERVLQASAGLTFKSLAYPFAGTTDETDTTIVFLNRDSFPTLADRLDQANHTAIGGGIGTLLESFLLSLEARLPTFTVTDIPVVNESIIALVHSWVMDRPQYSLNEHPMIAATLFDRARRYIDANIGSPLLSPGTMARALGMSRSKLYSIFEKQGGVVNYIRSRRLAACHRAFADVSETRSIQNISERYGMHDRSLFNRQFRERYGYSPNEVREAKLLEYVSGPSAQVPKPEWFGWG